MKMTKTLSVLMTGLMACAVQAADYYVSTEGNDANDGLSPEKAVKTLDKAFDLGGGTAGNNIYVQPGEYETNQEWGFDLQANLIGVAESRDQVVIRSKGNYRTLRMNAAGPVVTNLTIVGESTQKADKGGAIEMNGGTLVDCVIRDGSVKNSGANLEGGNLYVGSDNALVLNCEIYGGKATKRGGNVYVAKGIVRNCTIWSGACENVAGNVFMEAGTLGGCVLAGGSSTNNGGCVYLQSGVVSKCEISGGNGSNGGNVAITGGTIKNCEISGGVANSNGGNVYMTAGSIMDSMVHGGYAKGTDWANGGGNIFANPGRIVRCTISGGRMNDGKNQGGGIRSRDSGTVIEDCLIVGNDNGGVCLEGKGMHYNNTVVNNKEYGYWGYGSNPGVFVNNVVYGNGTQTDGNFNEWSGNKPAAADMYNCAFGAEKLAGQDISIYANTFRLSDDFCFVNAAEGNYQLVGDGALVDKGATDTRSDASATDRAGKPRTSGTVDIGCYEYQKLEMTVSMRYTHDLDHQYAPVTAAFTGSVENAPEGTVTYEYDFGDGKTLKTEEQNIEHEYAAPGIYTVTIKATCGSAIAEMKYENFITVNSKTIYVSKISTPSFPYNTPEKGYMTLDAAVKGAVKGMDILVSDGTYEQKTRIVVDKEITISGNNANPEAVVLRNTAQAESGSDDHRVMSIGNAAVVVSGITLEGGQVFKGNGGNLIISAGMISNCVIRSGLALAAADGEFAMGGGVALSGSGLVTHCVISNNEVRGSASGKWVQGGAVVFPWGSAGKLRHSLIAGNRWTPENAEAKGTAGIVYHSETKESVVENCTVVDNKIVGTCEASSKAGMRCDWDSIVRNTVIAGNRKGEDVSNVYLAQDGSTWKDRLNTCVTEDALPSGNASCWTATLDKMFRNYSAGDYRPKVGGALFNRGAVFPDVPLFDLMGVKRVFDTADRLATGTARIDVGCYESQALLGLSIIIR